MLANIFNGLYNALISGNNEALIYDSLKENQQANKYHEVLGKMRGYQGLAVAISATFGAAVVWLWGIRETFYVIVFCSFLLILISLNLIEPKIQTEKLNDSSFKYFSKSVKNIWKNKRLRYLTLAMGLDHGLVFSAHDFTNVFFQQFVPMWCLGMLRTLAHFLGAIGDLLSYKVSMMIGYTKTVIAFIGLNYVVNFLSVVTNCVASPFIKCLDAFAYEVAEPAQETLLQNDFTDQQRATMGSVVSLFKNLVYGVLSLVVGMLADTFSAYTALLISFGAAFFLLPIYYKGLKTEQ